MSSRRVIFSGLFCSHATLHTAAFAMNSAKSESAEQNSAASNGDQNSASHAASLNHPGNISNS